jgi:Arc/MetJ-type ribon-helix-helix transcriptional regulator
MARQTVTISLPAEMIEWIDSEVETVRFASRSHCIEYCVLQEIQKKNQGNAEGVSPVLA